MAATFKIETPQRWSKESSFDPEMSEVEVDRILTFSPFIEMESAAFPKSLPLRGILQNDTRIRKYRPGELVVRQGDYGNSAFMVLSGTIRVVLEPDLPAEVLGRRNVNKKNWFRTFAQLWSNPALSEVRKPAELRQDARVATEESSGRVKIFLQDVPRVLDEHKTGKMYRGDFFGEISALGRIPRTTTIFCEDEAELLEIRWQGLRDLMRFDPLLQKHIDTIYRQRALTTHFRKLPIFQHLNDHQLKELIDHTEFVTYGDYDWSGEYKRVMKADAESLAQKEPVISQEGDYPNHVIFVRAGFARLSQRYGRGRRTLNYLGAGQSYGLDEIAHNWRKKDGVVSFRHSLSAIGYTHLLLVPTDIMERLVLPTVPPEILPPLIEEVPREQTARAKQQEGKIEPDMMEFLAEHRFFNGTATMVIDLEACTRCDDCVRACASTHGNNPRFLRHGPVNGKIMVANACMHCSDPVCLIGCPTGAIHRNAFEGEVVINQASCIGCQVCATNCPYEAIRMVQIRDKAGSLIYDPQMKPIFKATKCDLCIEQHGGPSCERACPHDALVRVNMSDLDAFSKWLKR